MNSRFFAAPPLPIELRALGKHFKQMFARICLIVWQILVPFNPRPEEIESLPEPKIKITEAHVKQCQWIFDQAAARRVHLEQKAQSTFSLMVFLVPVLASLFVFFSSRAAPSGTGIHTLAVALLLSSAVILLLGFISAVRAVSVKTIETLFLNSVVDGEGEFREYSEAFHTRGLLYCAAINEAMNDHIAQFVKGSHILTAGAVIILFFAGIPTVVALSNLPSSPTVTKILGSVEVSSADLKAVHDDVANLRKELADFSKSRNTENKFKRIEEKLAMIEATLASRKKLSSMPEKSSKPPARESLNR